MKLRPLKDIVPDIFFLVVAEGTFAIMWVFRDMRSLGLLFSLGLLLPTFALVRKWDKMERRM